MAGLSSRIQSQRSLLLRLIASEHVDIEQTELKAIVSGRTQLDQ